MGCEPSSLGTKQQIPDLDTMYANARLPHPEIKDYKLAYEKEFFQIVNLIRT